MIPALQHIADIYPGRVFQTDELLERKYGTFDTWEYLDSGNESDVYITRNRDFVIKKTTPFSEDEYDYEDSDIDDEEDEDIKETIRRVERIKIELDLPEDDTLTTTLFVSPSYTVERKKDSDLKKYIENTPISPSFRIKLLMCLDIYKGLYLIHSKKMAHLDIKPENIFVLGRSLSIGDFGFLTRCTLTSKDLVGRTPGWKPNDVSTKRGKEVDLYSTALVVMGILLWDSDIIGKCREFADAINKIKDLPDDQTIRHAELCTVLEGVFESRFKDGQDNCFPEMSYDLTEILKRSILGVECGQSRRMSAVRAKQNIEHILNNV